jgi:hypothetical protein
MDLGKFFPSGRKFGKQFDIGALLERQLEP